MRSPNDDVQERGYVFGGQLVVEKSELEKKHSNRPAQHAHQSWLRLIHGLKVRRSRDCFVISLCEPVLVDGTSQCTGRGVRFPVTRGIPPRW
jgi:hypothetical protein